MHLDQITDSIQTINLIGFAGSLVLCMLIGKRHEWTRLWLLPALTYLINGTAFYIAVRFGLYDAVTRTLWSAGLRLHAIVVLFVALAIMAAMTKDED